MSNEELVAALSLENLLPAGLDVADESDRLVRELGLRHFFSPSWMNITEAFQDSDIGFLVRTINEGGLDRENGQLFVTLLAQFCFRNIFMQMPVLSEACTSTSLIELGLRLSCDQVSAFSADGKRSCIPHYVPDWLQRNGTELSTREPMAAEFGVFLSSFTVFSLRYV